MGRKKIDVKISALIKRCVLSHQRSLFCVLGNKARDQVVFLYHLLCKERNDELQRPSILWCFRKDSGFNFLCHKKLRSLKKKYSSNYSVQEDDIFDHFLASSCLKFCHYSDTTSVLGQTFNMLVIQDFEYVTPNILSRVIECIEGGGMIILLFSSTQTLQDIAFLKMDAHSRYLTSAHQTVDPVFNTRFILSLADCENCMIIDDSLRILMGSSELEATANFNYLEQKKQVVDLSLGEKDSCDILNQISLLCCTADQTKAVEAFISTLKEKNMNFVVSLMSSRGRGKSAALGLSISCALYLKYSNIYVTSPHLENLQTLFSFLIKGMNILDFTEGKDYSILYTTTDNKKLITELDIFHDHRQIVKYLNPTEFPKVGISDLVVIDEAAAIPLPVVKSWLKSNKVFMASTVNGYEGTGRSLSLKLMSQLRELSSQTVQEISRGPLANNKRNLVLKEIELNKAIRYADGDEVEKWLNSLFCLNSEITYLSGDPPDPESCQLYYVNKKILFSYQTVAEKFLQQLVALFVSSHYKNSPNDLLMMADAPSHHLFCLLPPVDKQVCCLPNVLCVIQVALEGRISKDSVIQELSHGKRASGDLIPWIISQQFQDDNFPMLSGARIVRIATHPNYQRMGYGQKALQLLFSYYEKNFESDHQCIEIERENSALLLNLNELEPQKLDYIGVSYGLTLELLRFWKKLEFIPLYVRQTASETTGEHSCIMVKSLKKSTWLPEYFCDFLKRFTTLVTSAFHSLPAALALEILHYKRFNQEISDPVTISNIQSLISECSFKRLQAYCNHLVDYHLIMDLIPILARAYFLNNFRNNFLSSIQEIILLCMGLQNKSVEDISQELKMETNEIMGLFIKIVKKMLHHLSFSQKKTSADRNYMDFKLDEVENQNSSMKTPNFKRKQKNYHKQKKKQRYQNHVS